MEGGAIVWWKTLTRISLTLSEMLLQLLDLLLDDLDTLFPKQSVQNICSSLRNNQNQSEQELQK